MSAGMGCPVSYSDCPDLVEPDAVRHFCGRMRPVAYEYETEGITG